MAPTTLAAVQAYFERKYGEEPAWHQPRIFCALKYFQRHAEEFNEGNLCINSRQGPSMGRPLSIALLGIYTDAKDEDLDTDWPVDEVKAIARRLEEGGA